MAKVMDDMAAEVAALAAAAGAAVVGVGRGGSGAVVGNGVIVTNAHNVRGDEVTVRFADGRVERAAPAGVDVDGDLAVISVDTGNAPVLALAATAPSAGSAVVAMANPAGLGVRASFGLVSAAEVAFRGPGGRLVSGAFEHTAPLVRGSSGGPVLDSAGAVVGINTHRIGDGFYVAQAAGDALQARIDRLARGESPRRVRLGIAVAPPHVARHLRRAVGLEARDGVLVHAVDADGPAGQAGIDRGDLIVSVGGTAVADTDALATALDKSGPGASVSVVVVRGAEERTVEVALPG